MGALIVSQQKVWAGKYDISGDLSAVALKHSVESKDRTTLGNATRQRLAGLRSVGMQLEGFYNAGTGNIDDQMFTNIGVDGVPVSIGPTDGSFGETAYLFNAEFASYEPGAKIGDMFAFSVQAEAADSPLVRGVILHNAARSASGNGSGNQLGAVTSAQRLYANIHLLSVTGSGSLIAKVQSDDNASFTSAADRITFATLTALGSQSTSVAGAITDDYVRVNYTITGFTSVTFVVAVGIK